MHSSQQLQASWLQDSSRTVYAHTLGTDRRPMKIPAQRGERRFSFQGSGACDAATA